MAKFLVALLIFSSGYFLSYLNRSVEIKETVKTKEVIKCDDELLVDIGEFKKLRSLEDKYSKAEEILGKVMLLFLANIHHEQQKEFDTNIKQKIAKEQCEAQVKEAIRERALTTASQAPRVSKKQMGAEELKSFRSEKALLSIETQKMRKVDPKMVKKNFAYAERIQDVLELNGEFKGSLFLARGRDQVKITFDFVEKRGKIDGMYESILSKNGQKYSHNRGQGGNRSIRLINKARKEFIIETSPSSFMQLKILNNEALEGYYFDNNKQTGLVKLFRN